MYNNIEEKINLLKKINTDDSRFIINVYESYQKHQADIENKIKSTTIILKDKLSKSATNIIDLDSIYSKPYFYTKMRIHLDSIIKALSETDISQMLQNPASFCKKIVLHKSSKNYLEIQENQIDIVDFIKILNQKYLENKNNCNENFIFIAKTIDEETLFKEEQLKRAIEIINIGSKEKQYERIYDEVYSYLKKDFVANNYCDFKNNKCVVQRHARLYPINRKNGCCFTRIRSCPHLQEGGSCNVECMACRLFSCKHLSERGITYYAGDFVLLKAFLTKKERKPLVFSFFNPKYKVLKKILNS